ncbi:MAG: cytochrome P460 family protein [Candidatus Marinimicrobia bacterium]|nr:cytochrome P460 family protein [Candidatus Neomarinimicrobiota bacterium]
MSKVLMFASILIISLLLVISCGKGKKDIEEMEADEVSTSESTHEEATLPGADAAELWKYITETSPYGEWDFWPGIEGHVAGNAPHGAIIRTYLSGHGAHNVQDPEKGTFENGQIIVKENFMPDTTLAAITVMYKVEGFNPDAADWFWAKYKPDGTVDAAGIPKGCVTCHGAKADNDFVMIGSLK